jgi:hypothetical protein
MPNPFLPQAIDFINILSMRRSRRKLSPTIARRQRKPRIANAVNRLFWACRLRAT